MVDAGFMMMMFGWLVVTLARAKPPVVDKKGENSLNYETDERRSVVGAPWDTDCVNIMSNVVD